MALVGLSFCLSTIFTDLNNLQVLADTFETRFEPFTRDKPRVCSSDFETTL